MLKLEQIHLLDNNDIIVEIMEPIVYTKVGSTLKSDDTVAREKANVHYTTARVVRIASTVVNPLLTVGTDIIIARNTIFPIQFPIEGYDSPKLGVINTHSVLAKITPEV